MKAPSTFFGHFMLCLLTTLFPLLILNGCNSSIMKDAGSGDYDGVLRRLDERQDSVDVQQALCFAARNGHLKIVRMLVEKRAKVNFYLRQLPEEQWPIYWHTPFFEPALYYAIDSKHIEIVNYLVEMGASVRKDTAMHPLMVAVWAGSTEIASYLISKGADVNALDAKHPYQRPLYCAVASGDLAMVRLFKSKGAVIPEGKAVLIAGYNKVSMRGDLSSTTIAAIDGIYSQKYVAEITPGTHSVMIEGSGAKMKGGGISIIVTCVEGELLRFQPMTSDISWNVVVTKY